LAQLHPDCRTNSAYITIQPFPTNWAVSACAALR